MARSLQAKNEKTIWADRMNDQKMMEKAINRILNVPTVVLRRIRGGKNHARAMRMLEAQLKKVMTRKNPPSPEYKKEGKEADEEEQERLRRIAKAVSLVHKGHVRRAVQSLTRKVSP